MPFWSRSREDPIEAGQPLIVGLGNPGPRYENTRHNIGFMVVERLAGRNGLSFKGSKQRADIARGPVDGITAILALPVTYMNDSGIAVSRLLSYYHVPRSRLLVVCDDLDLPFGSLRLRPSGSAGGQKGLLSIIQQLGTEDFARLRLGIGRPPGPGAIPHVLGAFPAEQERVLPKLL